MKNNIRYKGNTNNTSVIIFLNRKVKNSQRWYFAWENLRGGFCCCCCSFIFVLHFVVVLHSFLFFILLLLFFISFPGCFAMSPALHPGFSGPWRPPPALSSTLATFGCFTFASFSVTVLPPALQFWVGVFYPQAFFTLRSFTDISGSTCVYQGLPRSQQFFLQVCRASYWSSKHRPSPSVWITVNPQSS